MQEKYGVTKMYHGSKCDFLSNCLHAEVSAIQKASTDIDTLVVLRKTKDGRMASARPCNLCMSFIKEKGIKQIVYSTPSGYLSEAIVGFV